MATQQSEPEIKMLFEYWEEHFAPTGYIPSAENTHKIVEAFVRQNLGEVSFEKLTKVCKDLGTAIEYKGAPVVQQEVEAPKAGFKKGPRPDSRIDVSAEREQFAADVEDPSTPVFAKLQQEAHLEVQAAISGCTFQNRMGRVDHPLTSQRRDALRAIKVMGKGAQGEDIVLWGKTLQKVQEQLRQFDRDDARYRDYIR